MLTALQEEMNIRGLCRLGRFVAKITAQELGDKFVALKDAELREADPSLLDLPERETLRGVVRFGSFNWLLEGNINAWVEQLLGPKAVLHSYNVIITRRCEHDGERSYKFHRDHHFLKDTRTSAFFMMPLVDVFRNNGATEVVPGTHLFRRRPSQAYLEKYTEILNMEAGELVALDPAVWHRAGKNLADEPRPLLILRYTTALFKQQIDWCAAYPEIVAAASPTLKQRLGWECRTPTRHTYRWRPEHERCWRQGQYDMTNTSLHETGNELEF